MSSPSISAMSFALYSFAASLGAICLWLNVTRQTIAPPGLKYPIAVLTFALLTGFTAVNARDVLIARAALAHDDLATANGAIKAGFAFLAVMCLASLLLLIEACWRRRPIAHYAVLCFVLWSGSFCGLCSGVALFDPAGNWSLLSGLVDFLYCFNIAAGTGAAVMTILARSRVV
jgi:hypothetical protein